MCSTRRCLSDSFRHLAYLTRGTKSSLLVYPFRLRYLLLAHNHVLMVDDVA
nr:MAG TPA: hypothetical protein [Caudoviricetes sp.]